MEDADLRVGQDEANFIFERPSAFDQCFNFLGDARAIVRVKECAGPSERQWLIVRGKSEHAVHLCGPGEALLRYIKFPAAEAGELLGLCQKRFALAGLGLGAAKFGDVLDNRKQARCFPGLIRQGDAANEDNVLESVWQIVAGFGDERRARLDCR